jgi:hypothetical protein
MQQHEHDEEESTFGIALGFRTIEQDDQIFVVEAEIAPYVNAADELGATLVFHPVDALDPTSQTEELDWPTWPVDIDDDLERNPSDSLAAQFKSIVRQLHGMTTEQLREYLRLSREEAES